MDNQNITETELIERLKSLPLKDVPPDLTSRVMARISQPPTPLLHSIWNYISQTQTISFRPIYAFSVLLLICGAFLMGRFSQPVEQQIATIPPVSTELQPAMIEVPQSAYLVGRGLLQTDGSHEQALAFLKRASMLEPDNPEFAYWEGVGYWANGNLEQERQSYLRGLEINPDSLPLLINLGHNYLSSKNYQDALPIYQRALTIAPEEPDALYNTGLIYRVQGMIDEEINAWRMFLQNNRSGTKAFRALQRLNAYNDFSFRAYDIGLREVIVNQQTLLDDSLPEQFRLNEIESISSMLAENRYLDLEVVTFVENDLEAAQRRAFEIKRLIKNTGKDVSDRVKLSWFDIPERIESTNGESEGILSESILLFSHVPVNFNKETSI
ncbi:MAG: tetratricopeptide repeat protein [Desulfofustis sp.]|nr:tetratricopeptide repeat protein [Desulfofustis sp.]NNK14983.1 tetratricopeptide repeat protein [Desulfofustis sp.]